MLNYGSNLNFEFWKTERKVKNEKIKQIENEELSQDTGMCKLFLVVSLRKIFQSKFSIFYQNEKIIIFEIFA